MSNAEIEHAEFSALRTLLNAANFHDQTQPNRVAPVKRLPRRLLAHHMPLFLATCASVFLLYRAHPIPDLISRLSFATAYPALILISVTLVIGPLKLFSRTRVPVSIDLRRDVGIWAAVTGIFHAVIGQFVHMRPRPWLYYVYDDWPKKHLVPVRYDPFGLANYTGLFAVLILLLLLSTSNDASLRKFRTPGWKKLQRWNYAGFGLIAIHAFLYQALERQAFPFVATAILAVGLTLVVQYRGYLLRRAAKPEFRTRPR